jgi:hypothetical protein
VGERKCFAQQSTLDATLGAVYGGIFLGIVGWTPIVRQSCVFLPPGPKEALMTMRLVAKNLDEKITNGNDFGDVL